MNHPKRVAKDERLKPHSVLRIAMTPKGTPRLYLVGILGEIIQCIGMSLAPTHPGSSVLLSHKAGGGKNHDVFSWRIFIGKDLRQAAVETKNPLTQTVVRYIIGFRLFVVVRIIY